MTALTLNMKTLSALVFCAMMYCNFTEGTLITHVSRRLATDLTPVDFTFSIWGLLYCWMGWLHIEFLRDAVSVSDDTLKYLTLSYLGNCAWIYAFTVYKNEWLSLLAVCATATCAFKAWKEASNDGNRANHVVNCLGAYVSWLGFALVLSMGIVAKHALSAGDVSLVLAGLLALSVCLWVLRFREKEATIAFPIVLTWGFFGVIVKHL